MWYVYMPPLRVGHLLGLEQHGSSFPILPRTASLWTDGRPCCPSGLASTTINWELSGETWLGAAVDYLEVLVILRLVKYSSLWHRIDLHPHRYTNAGAPLRAFTRRGSGIHTSPWQQSYRSPASPHNPFLSFTYIYKTFHPSNILHSSFSLLSHAGASRCSKNKQSRSSCKSCMTVHYLIAVQPLNPRRSLRPCCVSCEFLHARFLHSVVANTWAPLRIRGFRQTKKPDSFFARVRTPKASRMAPAKATD